MNEHQIVAMTADEIDEIDGGTAWYNIPGHIIDAAEAAYDFGKKVGRDIGNLVYG